jgi:SAM-dependent methyltransferase
MTSFMWLLARGQAGRLPEVTMLQGWESEAVNWARFARTPGFDKAHENVNRPVLQELLPAPGRRTLDLACGEGRLSRLLRSLGHKVVGVDASPTMVRLAAAHHEAARAVLGDGGRLPFADEAFDLVVAYMCLHDFDEMPQAVAEVARVLEPSGRLCLAIPHPLNTAGTFPGKDADAPFVISGSYMAATPTRDTINRGDIRLTFHSEHRPLEAYTRALEFAGLLIEALREVVPGDDVVALDPSDRRWQRIPLFLHMRVVKPV